MPCNVRPGALARHLPPRGMTAIGGALLGLILILALASSAHAESKWSWKNLVPGSDHSAARASESRAKKPSMLARMNQKTKATLAKTRDIIVPDWLLPNTQDKVRRSGSAARRSAGTLKSDARTARRSILAPWKRDPPEPQRPRTVSEFLGQPRPEF